MKSHFSVVALLVTASAAAPTPERPAAKSTDRSPYRFHSQPVRDGINWILAPSESAPKEAPPMLIKFYRDESKSPKSANGKVSFTLEIENPKKAGGSTAASRWIDQNGDVVAIPFNTPNLLELPIRKRQLGGKSKSSKGSSSGKSSGGLLGKLGGGGDGASLGGLLGGGALPDLGALTGGGGLSGGITGAAGSIGENIGVRIGKSIGESIGKSIGKSIGEYIGGYISNSLGGLGGSKMVEESIEVNS